MVLHGYPSLKDQADRDDLRFKSPIKYTYFSFKAGSNARTIITLKPGQIVYGDILVVVSTAFSVTSFLQIGTLARTKLITSVALEFKGTSTVSGGVDSDDILKEAAQSLDIRYSITYTDGITATSGRGWGILQSLDLNLVEGFN